MKGVRSLGCAILSSLVAAAPAAAQTLLTPEGPATLREQWLGASTAEGRPPEVIVRWSVTVEGGGRPGYVRLRVLRPGALATLVGSSPRVWLPADPGTYAFGLRPGIRYDYRDSGLGLEQETGGHAIVRTYPSQPELNEFSDPFRLHALDIFRPPLPDGAVNVEPSEHILGQGLRVRQFSEPDIDEDGLGDKSQDRGDLRILSATITARKTIKIWRGRTDRVVVQARIRNVGTTTRQLPHIVVPEDSLGGAGCARPIRPGATFSLFCSAPPLKPGRETVAQLVIYTLPHDAPTRLSVAAEGIDVRPQDNSMPLRCGKTCGSLRRWPRVG